MTNKVCVNCGKDALYRNKLKELYCYHCYWELEENKFSKPRGDTFTDSNVYRSCPYCGSGDLCDTDYCIAKCLYCGIIGENRKEGYCSLDCFNAAEKERKQREELEKGKWCSFCSQPSGNIKRNDYPDKYFCRDCFLKKKPDLKLPDKRTLRKRKRSLRSDWACPHYEAEYNDKLITDIKEIEKERIIKSHWLPEWKPVMKNKDGKNICADCYHDSVEYLLLVQELTTRHFANIYSKLTSDTKKDYEKLKNNSLNNIEEFEEVKEKIRKEIINVNNIERERERERAKLKLDIQNLENKTNKTPEEEKELENKRKELEDLDKKPKNNSPNSSANSFDYKPWLIGGGCLLLFVGLIIYLIYSNLRKRK